VQPSQLPYLLQGISAHLPVPNYTTTYVCIRLFGVTAQGFEQLTLSTNPCVAMPKPGDKLATY